MSVVLIRSLILYIVVIFGVRLMGKRQLGELQPSELVITILISNIATLPLEDTSIPLVLGILPILTLVCFEVVISWVTLKSLRMRRIISGRPKIIVRNGQIEQATMRDLRLSVDDLMTALRQQQVFDISQVQFAVMETTGTVSVYLKAACQPLTPEDVALKKAAQDPPVAVIQDGCVMNKSLAMLGKNQAWLVRSETSRLLNDLDQLRETVLQSPEQAEQAFQQFHDQWEKSERRLNLVVWRDKVVQIDVTVAHLTPMLGADCDELDSELSEARMWIQRLSESEMPFWWNIL